MSSLRVMSHMLEGHTKSELCIFFQTAGFEYVFIQWNKWSKYLLGSFNTSWIKASFRDSNTPSVWAKVVFVTD